MLASLPNNEVFITETDHVSSAFAKVSLEDQGNCENIAVHTESPSDSVIGIDAANQNHKQANEKPADGVVVDPDALAVQESVPALIGDTGSGLPGGTAPPSEQLLEPGNSKEVRDSTAADQKANVPDASKSSKSATRESLHQDRKHKARKALMERNRQKRLERTRKRRKEHKRNARKKCLEHLERQKRLERQAAAQAQASDPAQETNPAKTKRVTIKSRATIKKARAKLHKPTGTIPRQRMQKSAKRKEEADVPPVERKEFVERKELDDGSLHFTVPGIPGEFFFTKSSTWYRDGEKKGDGKREEKSYLLSGPPRMTWQAVDTDLLEDLFYKPDPDTPHTFVPEANGPDPLSRLKKRTGLLSLLQFEWLDKHRDLILNNPARDFTRKRKATLTGTLGAFVGLGLRSIREFNKDIVDQAGLDVAEISEQAFAKNVDKLSDEGLGYLFALSSACLKEAEVMLGRNIYIVDGMRLTFRRGSFEPDKDAHCDTGVKKGYDDFNIVALYDLGAHGFRDYQILKRAFANERNGLIELLERNPGLAGIFLFDRGFPSYNVIYRMEQYRKDHGGSYVARVPETEGVVRTLAPQYKNGSNTEWDLTRTVTIARTNTAEFRNRYSSADGSRVFVPIDGDTVFDAIPNGDKTTVCSMDIRIVHVKVKDPKTDKDVYVTLVTNTDYTLEELKKLYALRWKEEVAFKVLKDAVGLNHLHFLRMDRIAKEICIRLYAYNLGASLVFSEEAIKAVNVNGLNPNKPLKHQYRSNFTSVMCDLRKFLVGSCSFDTLFARMVRYKSAVRDGRTAERKTPEKRPRYINAPAY